MILLLLNYSAILVYLFMGLHAYKANPKERSNRLFLVVCLLFAYNTVMEIIEGHAGSPENAYMVAQISKLGWLLYPGFLLAMALLVSRNDSVLRKPIYKGTIFVPGILLALFELFINDYSLRNSQIVWNVLWIEYAYTYLYLFLCVVLIMRWKERTDSQREKKQAKIIFRFALFTFVVGIVNDLVLATIIPDYPLTDQFIFLILVFSIWYAGIRYKFLGVSSLITAEDIVNKISEIVIVLTPRGFIADINQAGEAVLGYKKDELEGRQIQNIVDLNFDQLLQEVATKQSSLLDGEHSLKTRGNVDLPVTVSVSSVKDKSDDLIGILIICQDKTLVQKLQIEINERRIKERQLKYLSLHDSLTGLHNRTYFEQQMHQQKGDCSIIICDVDGLKFINDTLGHDVGDQVLIKASSIIKSTLDNKFILSRIGGDEFAVLIPHEDREIVHRICSAINRAVNEYNLDNPELMLSISVGSAVNSGLTNDIHELFKEADDNMYREKLNHIHSFRNSMVQGMMKTLEARDFITEGHAERMKDLIWSLGSHVGLQMNVLNKLQLLAQFHDIGKVGISDKILFKPNRLTRSERMEMQRHSEIGYRIAQAIPDLSSISDFILKHHECWDGKGYPLGIKEEEIPLECRILAIVDAFDAMTNDRPYRKAMTEEAAIIELQNHSGSQFDPQLVAVFLAMLEDKKQEKMGSQATNIRQKAIM